MRPESVFMPELWRLTLEDLQTWRACPGYINIFEKQNRHYTRPRS